YILFSGLILQVPLIQYSQQLGSTLSSHDTCFTQAADSLFFMHEGLQQARAPAHDVPSAIEVLLTGSYQHFPKCVENVGIQSTLSEDEQKPALKKLDMLVQSKLLEASLPKEISEVKGSNGTALLCVDGEFKVLVTLGYRGHLSMWRILNLELLVGERSELVKLEESQRHVLGDDLERRMAAAENPFMTLYTVIHELCIALIMDTVIRQEKALRQGRWKDTIRFELVSDGSISHGGSASSTQLNPDGESDLSGLRTPALKVLYWLDFNKTSGPSESKSCPFIKIEPGHNLHIKCLHNTFVIDPLTAKEAEFYLNQSYIDVEKLLLRVICCNRYTRSLEIQKELGKSVQSNLDEPDVDYKRGQEVLRVRGYGSSFFTLGINIRNGCFLLQSFQNILEPSVLLDCEEALNQGSMTAGEVFMSLRSKSILHLFASIGRFLANTHGSSMLLMGFPDCGSSYFLLMLLDKEFKPKLLETQSDPSGKAHSSNNLNHILEDEMNMSLLNWGKLLSFMPSAAGSNGGSEQGILPEIGLESSMQLSGCPRCFSSVVDEVFGHEKGPSTIIFSVKNISSYSTSPASYFGSPPMNLHAMKAATPSPKWDTGMQISQINNVAKVSSMDTHYIVGSLSSGTRRSTTMEKLSASKSEQDLASLRSGHLIEVGSCTTMDDDQPRLISDNSKDTYGSCSARLLSHPQTTSPQITVPGVKTNGLQSSPSRPFAGFHRVAGSSSCTTTPVSHPPESAIQSPSQDLPSAQAPISTKMVTKTERYSYGKLIVEANKVNAPSGIYISALLYLLRHCSLCIKHTRLTSQMEALHIPYVEVGLRNASSNIWFRLPFARGDLLGSMYWDVKINDQHFMDLWDLQKGSSSTPWGSGIRIANTSDIDSHIRYDPDGVVLSYQSVKANSIKKLVADIQRLSNARLFALGMQKLLGVRADEKLEECCTNSDVKAPTGIRGVPGTADKLSEQMRRAFRIEAVGLMSLWFSFESSKEGCTMHVSLDQLWLHTKLLEDFINGAEVASLLDCIRLTAGPLHAVAAATRPARAGPVPGVPGVIAAMSSIPKQARYLTSSLGLLPGNSAMNVSQAGFVLVGNPAASSVTSNLANQGLHGAAMLAAAGRGGPGIVQSSLLPIDVSVVLRSPYWIQIIYRKNFTVWLQPATPPKGGSSIGGSLPCPQFHLFIMEHVAQDLNGLDLNFTIGQQLVGGLENTKIQNPSSGFQLSAANGNRVNLLSLAATARPRKSNSCLVVVGSGVAFHRSPGTSAPAHVRGELNTTIIGLGDDGGYGGGWVPLVALKKVVRGILKYLGVLWLFAQLPHLLKEILGSILKDNEGALLNLDGYVFAVNVHRVQLLLQQQQQNSMAQEELAHSEISEICDYFSPRVASEPYDASRIPHTYPHKYAAGGADWLPYSVSVRLRYLFGENPSVSFLDVEGSHGGQACWFRVDDWEKCKQRVARAVEVNGSLPADVSQGRLRLVADGVQRTLHLCLQGLRDGGGFTASSGTT
ncbi:hypothetical protein I3760_07G067500, partial [Carya illinoinensis]